MKTHRTALAASLLILGTTMTVAHAQSGVLAIPEKPISNTPETSPHESPAKTADAFLSAYLVTQRTTKLADDNYTFNMLFGPNNFIITTKYDHETHRWTILRASVENEFIPDPSRQNPRHYPMTVTAINNHPSDNSTPFIAPMIDQTTIPKPFYPKDMPVGEMSETTAEAAARHFLINSYTKTISKQKASATGTPQKKSAQNVTIKKQVASMKCDITVVKTSHNQWLTDSFSCKRDKN